MDNHRVRVVRKCVIEVLVWLFIGAMPAPSIAQNTYRTDLLKNIAEKCGLISRLDTVADGEYFQFAHFKSLPLTVIVARRHITHIGYSLFSPKQRKGFGEEICNFIERYFLELDIPTREHISTTQRMKEDGVRIIKGNLNIHQLRYFCSDTTMCINLQTINEREYTMGWRKDSIWQYVLSFPIEYDLLHGTNMDERERRLLEDLRLTPFIKDSLKIDKYTKIKKAWQDNYYTIIGESYILPNLNTNRYLYKDKEGHYKPIYSKVYPIESLANLFTSNLINNDYILDIKLRKYGLKTDTLNVPLRNWISYCQQMGCKAFFGIISLEKDNIATCELIMHNHRMGYNHIMKITFPMSTFDERKGRIQARLNSYVNSSRIKNLFAD